jgi:hypothetical protein
MLKAGSRVSCILLQAQTAQQQQQQPQQSQQVASLSYKPLQASASPAVMTWKLGSYTQVPLHIPPVPRPLPPAAAGSSPASAG